MSLLSGRDLLETYSSNALSFSRQFSWDTTAIVFERLITGIS